jgi:hypothetical protein
VRDALCWCLWGVVLGVGWLLLESLLSGPGGFESKDWQSASKRVHQRVGIGEVVLLNPAGCGAYARLFSSAAVTCPPPPNDRGLRSQPPPGLWVVGEAGPRKSESEVLKGYRRFGTIQFGKVSLHHGWGGRKGRGGP